MRIAVDSLKAALGLTGAIQLRVCASSLFWLVFCVGREQTRMWLWLLCLADWKNKTSVYSCFTKKLPTDNCIRSIGLPLKWLCLSTSVTGYHDPIVCCGQMGLEWRTEGCWLPHSSWAPVGGSACLLQPSQPRQCVGEQRRPGGQRWEPPAVLLLLLSAFLHSLGKIPSLSSHTLAKAEGRPDPASGCEWNALHVAEEIQHSRIFCARLCTPLPSLCSVRAPLLLPCLHRWLCSFDEPG